MHTFIICLYAHARLSECQLLKIIAISDNRNLWRAHAGYQMSTDSCLGKCMKVMKRAINSMIKLSYDQMAKERDLG